MTSITGEYHTTTSRPTSRLTIALGIAALFATYAGVQLYHDNVEQRAKVEALHARGCPDKWRGKPFVFSAEETVNVLRPGTVRVACYYRKGTPA